ncbi:hypothetical protein H8959_001723 [Pygathrix nigripes]
MGDLGLSPGRKGKDGAETPRTWNCRPASTLAPVPGGFCGRELLRGERTLGCVRQGPGAADHVGVRRVYGRWRQRQRRPGEHRLVPRGVPAGLAAAAVRSAKGTGMPVVRVLRCPEQA